MYNKIKNDWRNNAGNEVRNFWRKGNLEKNSIILE
jgi:hypothetical protein